METVQPIRDVKQIERVKKALRSNGNKGRDLLLFVLGVNTGLRISDLLRLKVGDVIDGKGKVRDYYEVKEQKTGKVKRFKLNENVKKALKDYFSEINGEGTPNRYLFASRKGENVPITRQQAWTILSRAARKAGIKERIGTHTLRKTFGYHAYKAGTDLTLLQQVFNHAAPSVTLRYIGITQDQIDDVYVNLNL